MRSLKFFPLASVLAILCSILAPALQAQSPDYVADSPQMATDDVFHGDPIPISFDIRNLGLRLPRSDLLVRYLIVAGNGVSTQLAWTFSEDESLNFTDLSVTQPAENDGTPTTHSNFLFIPEDITSGNYAFHVVVDPQNDIEESDETNNVLVLASGITVGRRPDLEVQHIQNVPPRVLDAGEQFDITTRIVNTGDPVNIDPFLVDFFLFLPIDLIDRVGPVDDFRLAEGIFLGRHLTQAFPIGQQTAVGGGLGHIDLTATVGLPFDLTALNYRIGVNLDPEDTLPESAIYISNGNTYYVPRNTFAHGPTETVTVAYVRDRPDYAPLPSETGFSPTSIPAGEFVTFTGRVRNLTSFPGEEVTTIYHTITALSGPAVPRYIGTSFLLPIAGNGQHTFIANLRVPGNLPPGEYRYTFVADSADIIVEGNELNNLDFTAPPNTLTVTPSILPNLSSYVPNADFAPTTIDTGGVISVDIPITNSGSVAVVPFDVRIALSEDVVAGDSDDIPIGTFTVTGGIAPGATATIDTSIPLPTASTLPPGNYYLTWKIDPADAIEEFDEADNDEIILDRLLTVVIPFGDRPDLLPTELVLQTPILPPGGEYAIDVTISNSGLSDADTSNLAVYLTSDTIFEKTNAFELLGAVVTRVDEGSRETLRLSATLPDSDKLPSGTFYFVVKADAKENIDELNETNNTVVFTSSPILIRPTEEGDWPDLKVTSVSATPKVLAPNSVFSQLVTVRNDGASDATGVVTRLVIKAAAFSGGDEILLATFGPETILAGESSSHLSDVRLPDRTDRPDGIYFLSWTVDPDDLVPELNENANRSDFRIDIRSRPTSLILFNSDPGSLVIALNDTHSDSAYAIEYSFDLNKWYETGLNLLGDPDAPIITELPPIELHEGADALFLRAAIIDR